MTICDSVKRVFRRTSRNSSELPDPTQQNPYPNHEPPHQLSKDSKKMPASDPTDNFAPPPGPPPGKASPSFSPPPGPPPGFHEYPAPPPFDPLDDDADLPPPPGFTELYYDSYTTNATEDDAKRGKKFTDENPLYAPREFSNSALQPISTGNLALQTPPPRHFRGMIRSRRPGIEHVSTTRNCPDTTLISMFPLFAALQHHPSKSQRDRRLYFEVTVESMPEGSAIAIGYVAMPYPSFRLPGWERGSLAVHGDDGHRYANDPYGGREFVEPFRQGDTVGIGMNYPVLVPGENNGIEVVFTRNGQKEKGWMLNEERDAKDENDPTPGLNGNHDVYAAIGVYGGDVKLSVQFFNDFRVPDIFGKVERDAAELF